MKNKLMNFALVSALFSTSSLFASSGHYLECKNAALDTVLMVIQEVESSHRAKSREAVVQFTFYDRIDSGRLHHHAPIYLPGSSPEPFTVKIRQDGLRTYYENPEFTFVVKLAPLDYGDGETTYDGKLLEGTSIHGVELQPEFLCTLKNNR